MVRLLSTLLSLVLGASAWAALPVSPFIMGPPVVPPLARAQFLHSINPKVDLASALNFALLYEEEAALEGVNPDLAFAQMLLETSFLRYGGQVSHGQNNFSGLGALDGTDAGLTFASPRMGVRAQVQHLKYYATNLPLNGVAVNPRLSLVKRASAPTVWQLSKAWASDPDYGKKLMALLARMVAHADRISTSTSRSALQSVAPPRTAGN